METLFFGYDTDDPYLAERLYKKRFGIEPTVIIARPEMVVKSHPLLVRSNHGCAGGLLVTHFIQPKQVTNGNHRLHDGFIVGAKSDHRLPVKEEIPKSKRGRPSHPEASCPHCGNDITSFERLGHWYGWALGIEPIYWEALRKYVFHRDRYTCHDCEKKLPPSELRCHHVVAKEIGGSDSARNLRTLCADCHLDEHPIYPDEE